jgi:response regulator RpfG family c-di-GMP phosphodiesterase
MIKKLNIMILEEFCMNKNDMESIFPHAFKIVRTSNDVFKEVELNKVAFDMIILDEDTRGVISILDRLKKSTSIPIFLMASKPKIKKQAISYNVDGIIHEPFDMHAFNKVFNSSGSVLLQQPN